MSRRQISDVTKATAVDVSTSESRIVQRLSSVPCVVRRRQRMKTAAVNRTRSPKDAYGEFQSVDNTHQQQQIRFRLIGKQVACSER